MFLSVYLSLLLTFASTLPLSLASFYTPLQTTCPRQALVRPAKGLSDSEETYRVARKAVADVNLKSWLLKQNSAFDTTRLPSVALALSGGGYRALMVGGGVIQGLDSRDSNVATSGLFQGITYFGGLSGGSWLVSSFAGNNFPTISSLRDNLWKAAFQDSLLDPGHLLASYAYGQILDDILEKHLAGYPTTLTDLWSRLLSYQLLQGFNGGVGKTLSSITSLSNFTNHAVPYPIITSLGVKTWLGECLPGPNATQYEFSPYEFGSWDKDVSAFTNTHFLGTTVSKGVATGNCVTNYDNLGLVLGTSSNLFNEFCAALPPAVKTSRSSSGLTGVTQDFEVLLQQVHQFSTKDEYATYPNPFYNYASATGVFNAANNVPAQPQLHLVDGGEALQNNPIWPFLQPARNVSAIIVSDNSADTSDFHPNGSEILTTYVQAKRAGLTRMPVIPPVETFVARGLNKRAVFFGCGDAAKITIVWLPNANYVYPSNTPTEQFIYSQAQTTGIIANGQAVVAQNGTKGWGTCLGCALMEKQAGRLPPECPACFAQYCYK